MNLLEHWPDLLTVQEAAEILRADPAAVESYISSGEVKHAEIAGKMLMPRRFLEKFIEMSCKKCYNEGIEICSPASDSQEAQHLATKISSEVVYLDKQVSTPHEKLSQHK